MITVNYSSSERSKIVPTTSIPTVDLTPTHTSTSIDAADQWLELLSESEVDELADLLANLDAILE